MPISLIGDHGKMKTSKNISISAAVFLIAFLLNLTLAVNAYSDTLFWEDFNGYSYHYDDPGIPKISEGADEIWYGGRFEYFDGGTINQDLAIQAYGGSTNPTPVGRFEDEAGLLFNISTADYFDVKLSFDWRTFSASGSDRLVAGYYVGDLNFGTCTGEGEAGCFRDFFTDDLGSSQSAAVNWWDTQWTEIVRGKNNVFQSITDYALPDGEDSIWVAFWMDNGEGDFGKIDNVHVTATLVPEPVSSTLFIIGAAVLAARRFWKKKAQI